MKALVEISPAGCITVVSKIWSGKVLDKEIILESGVLSLLEDGDNGMADRGFDIREILPAGLSLLFHPSKANVTSCLQKQQKKLRALLLRASM